MSSNDTRRVWVGCLACYNAGRLVGDWLPPDEGPEWVCPNSPTEGEHEETWVFDHEGFGTGERSESEGSPAHFAELDATLGAVADADAYMAYRNHVGADYADPSGFEDAYQGTWSAFEAFAEELFDDVYLHEVPEHVQSYIDYDKFARDLLCGGDYWTADAPDYQVYVFAST